MPGRPVLKRLSAAIEEAGGDKVIFDQVVEGVAISKIMEPWGVHRTMFYRWLEDGGEKREKAYERAKRRSADAHIEQAEEILFEDTPPGISSAEVAMRKEQAGFKKWLAGKRDREQYGEDRQAGVQVNITAADLHLQALEDHGSRLPGEEEPEQIPAEVVE